MIIAQLINELKTMDQSVEILIDLGDGLVEITDIDRGMVRRDDGEDDDWCYVLLTTETDAKESDENRRRLEQMGHVFGDA